MAKVKVFNTAFSSYKTKGTAHGQGGSGIVYSVVDEDGQTLALKLLDPGNVTTEKVKRFKNELTFCNRKEHKNIVKIVDNGYENVGGVKCPFYVMPFYDLTLRQLMTSKIPKDKVLPSFSQMLDGIEAAHLQQVWHRDIKPENILYDGVTDTFVVADFGIAHFEEDSLATIIATSPGERLANFLYAAPEQRVKGGKVDQRADIYALGMILNEMFTGVPPHGVDFKKIQDAYAELSYLDEIVDKMLKQDPNQRFSCIDDIKKELIARQNDFIKRQELDKIRNTVMPVNEIQDPLIEKPVQIVSAVFENSKIVFTLNQPIGKYPIWMQCFHGLGDYRSIDGRGPDTVEFGLNFASIYARENEAEMVTELFKEYVQKANRDYMQYQINVRAKKERDEKKEIQRAIKERETNLRVSEKLRKLV